MDQKILKLAGEEVDEVVLMEVNLPYKSGQRKERGETFNRYRYNGIAFAVNTTNPFCEQFAKGTVATVKLIEGTREVEVKDEEGNVINTQTVPTLTFDSSTSFAQAEARAYHSAKMNAIATMATDGSLAGKLNEIIENSVA